MSRLTKTEKQAARVEIAKDVLKWLRAGKLNASPGTYCALPFETEAYDAPLNLQTALQKKVTKTKPCHVCALGALFIGAVDKYNKVEVPVGGYLKKTQSGLTSRLKDYFDVRQLRLIESAFEGGNFAKDSGTMFEYIAGFNYRGFYFTYRDSRARLKAIMENIIANEGTFVLARKTKGKD